MKKLILIFGTLFFINFVSAICEPQYSFFKCQDVDTNLDYQVNSLDSLQDYNIDGIINGTDQYIFNTFFNGCSWDKDIKFDYVTLANITKRINLQDIYQTLINMKSNYGMHRPRHLYPNGTCSEGKDEYNWSMSTLMKKNQGCSYNASLTIHINNNGALDINSCELYFEGEDSEYNLNVYNGGILNILNSKLGTTQSTSIFGFNAYPNSTLNIDNSVINRYGGGLTGFPYYHGLTIATDKASVRNSLFNGTYDGIMIYKSNPILDNLQINVYTNGLYIIDSPNASVRNIKINGTYGQTFPWYGIVLKNSNLKYISGYFNGLVKDIQGYSPYNFSRYWTITLKINKFLEPTDYYYEIYNSNGLVNEGGFTKRGSKDIYLLEYTKNLTSNKIYSNNYTIYLYKNSLLEETKEIIVNKDTTYIMGQPTQILISPIKLYRLP